MLFFVLACRCLFVACGAWTLLPLNGRHLGYISERSGGQTSEKPAYITTQAQRNNIYGTLDKLKVINMHFYLKDNVN